MLSPKDPFTIRDSCDGVLVSGGTGGGKTSGPGRCVGQSYLKAGYGGLVLVAKNERVMWEGYCRATGRSARVATVMLTQNISNFYAALGGTEKGKAETDSLFANLNTKMFCANGDPVTNDWAASIIGRSRQYFCNSSNSYDPGNWLSSMTGLRGMPHTNTGVTETIEFEVQPRAFTTLRKGGPANRWQVDAVVFQNGRRFARSGKTWMKVSFSQR
jgi:hypothetical protein